MHDTVIYTAIFGGYDRLFTPRRPIKGFDLVCFTDNPDLRSDEWDIRYEPRASETSSAANRRYKMLPHLHLADYSHSLYIDGNIRVLSDPTEMVDRVLGQGSIGIAAHPERDCVYDEVEACIKHGKISAQESCRWLDFYQSARMSRHAGLFENNVIVRRHHDPKVIGLMQAWWDLYEKCGGRDQLSLVVLAKEQGVVIHPIIDGPRCSRKFLSITAHESDKRKGMLSFWRSHVNANARVNLPYYVIAQIIKVIDMAKQLIRRVPEEKMW